MFDIVDTKTETLADRCKNYLWVNKSKKCITYIRNLYKTAKTYGQKSYDIKNERFIRAVKCCQKMQYAFPICDDPSLIGYHIRPAEALGRQGRGGVTLLRAPLASKSAKCQARCKIQDPESMRSSCREKS